MGEAKDAHGLQEVLARLIGDGPMRRSPGETRDATPQPSETSIVGTLQVLVDWTQDKFIFC